MSWSPESDFQDFPRLETFLPEPNHFAVLGLSCPTNEPHSSSTRLNQLSTGDFPYYARSPGTLIEENSFLRMSERALRIARDERLAQNIRLKEELDAYQSRFRAMFCRHMSGDSHRHIVRSMTTFQSIVGIPQDSDMFEVEESKIDA
jgi:hypothetical protein